MHKKPAQRVSAKKRRAAPKHTAPPPSFEEDPPPLIGLAELAKLADVSDQTILDMRADPHAPKTLAGRYPREPWLRYIANVKIYGRRAMKQMDVREAAAAITGRVEPPAAGPGGAAAPDLESDTQAEEIGTTATTTAELMRVRDKSLLKYKLAEEIITRRLANQERRKRLVPRQAVEEVFFSRAQSALTIARRMKLDLPPKLLGLDRPEMEERLAAAFDEFFAAVAALGEPIEEAPAPADPKSAEPAAPPDEKRESP